MITQFKIKIYRLYSSMKQKIYLSLLLFFLTTANTQAQYPDWMILQTTVQNLTFRGEYSKAIAHCEQQKAERFEKEGKYNYYYAFCCNLIGVVLQEKEEFEAAEAAYQEALTILEEILYGGKGEITATVRGDYFAYLTNLALLYTATGEHAKAYSLLSKIQPFFEHAVKMDQAVFHNSFGLICFRLKKYEESEKFYQVAMDLMHEMVNSLEYKLMLAVQQAVKIKFLGVCINFASLYTDQGRFEEAEQVYQQVDSLFADVKTSEDAFYLANLNYLRAQMLSRQQKYEEAIQVGKKIYQLLQNPVGREQAVFGAACHLIASNIILLHQKELLEGTIKKTIIDEVEAYLQQSIENFSETKDIVITTQAQMDLAGVYQYQKKYKEARALLSKSNRLIATYLKKNLLLLSEKDKTYFVDYLNGSFNFFNSLTFRTALSLEADIALVYQNQLFKKGILLESTQRARKEVLEGEDEALKKTYLTWKDRVIFLNKLYQEGTAQAKQKIEKTEAEVNQLEAQLSAQSESIAQLINQKEYSWKDVQRSLQPNEVAIEIVRIEPLRDAVVELSSDSITYVAMLVFPEGDLKFITNLDGKKMEASYFKYYQENLKTADRQSYQHYWAWIDRLLKEYPYNEAGQRRKIYFSAEGIYHQLNLAALLNPETNNYTLNELDIILVNNTKELIERTQKNTTVVTKKEKAKKQELVAVLMGDPLYDLEVDKFEASRKDFKEGVLRGGEGDFFNLNEDLASIKWDRLEDTATEVREIAKLLENKKWQVNTYLQEQALEEIVKKIESPDVLHIATHGFFINPDAKKERKLDSLKSEIKDLELSLSEVKEYNASQLRKIQGNPLLRSGLVFTGVTTYAKSPEKFEGDNGILTAYEALTLDLSQTDLVVLSACQTGQGDIGIGEGVYGLQRAFKIAGAKTIVMSLWSVDDRITAQLMTEFYKQWLGGKSKREAFYNAQVKVLREGNKYPFYWGAFVMLGE